MTSPAYNIALNVHDAALHKYRSVTKSYREQTIGDAAFVAAYQEMKAADFAFDVAYDIESNLPEED